MNNKTIVLSLCILIASPTLTGCNNSQSDNANQNQSEKTTESRPSLTQDTFRRTVDPMENGGKLMQKDEVKKKFGPPSSASDGMWTYKVWDSESEQQDSCYIEFNCGISICEIGWSPFLVKAVSC